jgi:hypothetical protein
LPLERAMRPHQLTQDSDRTASEIATESTRPWSSRSRRKENLLQLKAGRGRGTSRIVRESLVQNQIEMISSKFPSK